jgi:hypothetical protein
VQLTQLTDGRGEPAFGFRSAVQGIIEASLLVRNVPVDLFGVVASPVDVEDRGGDLLLCDCLVIVHFPSKFPSADAT